jgi:hypothetical protein
VLGYKAGVQSPVDVYLEHGTKFMYTRPFFFSSALLEEAPHMRRLLDRVARWLDEVDR